MHLHGALPANADSWRDLPHGKEMEDQIEGPPCDALENRQRMLVLLRTLSNIDDHFILLCMITSIIVYLFGPDLHDFWPWIFAVYMRLHFLYIPLSCIKCCYAQI